MSVITDIIDKIKFNLPNDGTFGRSGLEENINTSDIRSDFDLWRTVSGWINSCGIRCRGIPSRWTEMIFVLHKDGELETRCQHDKYTDQCFECSDKKLVIVRQQNEKLEEQLGAHTSLNLTLWQRNKQLRGLLERSHYFVAEYGHQEFVPQETVSLASALAYEITAALEVQPHEVPLPAPSDKKPPA